MVDRVKLDCSAISQAVFSANFFEAQYHRLAAMGLSTRCVERGECESIFWLNHDHAAAAEPRRTDSLVTLQPLTLLLRNRVPILFSVNLSSLFSRRLAKVSDGYGDQSPNA